MEPENAIEILVNSGKQMPAGYLFDNKFEIVSVLGIGGKGVVYKARHLTLDDFCALKVMRQEVVLDDGAKARFQREAKIASQLKHPNIVTVRAFGVSSDTHLYLAMELLEGNNLADMIGGGKRLTLAQFKEIFAQICSGLSYAHNQGVLHRDIKPGNIFVGETDNGLIAKLIDFGLAKAFIPETEQQQAITSTGAFAGTPAYMSPEQCMGGQLTTATDIYSLSAVMFEALLGRQLFSAESDLAIMQKHLREEPAFPADSSVPSKLREVVLKGLSKSPADRPASVGSFVDMIASIDTNNKSAHSFPSSGKRLAVVIVALVALAMITFTASSHNYVKPDLAHLSVNKTPSTFPRIHNKSIEERIDELYERRKVGYANDKRQIIETTRSAKDLITEAKSENVPRIVVKAYLKFFSLAKEISPQEKKELAEQLNDYVQEHFNELNNEQKYDALTSVGGTRCWNEEFAYAINAYEQARRLAETESQLAEVIKQLVVCNYNLGKHKEVEKLVSQIGKDIGGIDLLWEESQQSLVYLAMSQCDRKKRQELNETLAKLAPYTKTCAEDAVGNALATLAEKCHRNNYAKEEGEAKQQSALVLENYVSRKEIKKKTGITFGKVNKQQILDQMSGSSKK